jgi:DNA-binding MarR family transcriptional regulator
MSSNLRSSREDTGADEEAESPSLGLGPALRRAWLGYQLRIDSAMADAGFGERRFPDGRVLRLCAGQGGSTISAIGRELGMTRQGAGKVVGYLSERGYVTVTDSATSRREKSVTLTSRGTDYLRAQGAAARAIENELRSALGASGFSALFDALDVLETGEATRMRSYLQRSTER